MVRPTQFRLSRSRYSRPLRGHAFAGRSARAGFTLLEVMLVMGIIIMLAGLAVAALMNANDDAMEGVAKVKCSTYATACKQYKLKVGQYPTKLEDLVTQPQGVSKQKWRRPFVEKLELDPWGQPYQLSVNPTAHQVIVSSNGVDMKPGTEDDISNQD